MTISRRRTLFIGLVCLAGVAAALFRFCAGDEPEADQAGEPASSTSLEPRSAAGTPASPGFATAPPDLALEVSAPGTPATVSGRVIFPDDSRATFVDIVFRSRSGERTANSGAAGRYSLTLEPGMYEVHAIGDRILSANAWRLAVKQDLTFDIRVRRLLSLSGRVISAEGRPVSGAQVAYMPTHREHKALVTRGELDGWAETASDGTFAVDVLPGTAYLRAERDRATGGTLVRIEDAPPNVEIVLHETAELTGRVLDVRGQPVPGAHVHVAAYTRASGEVHEAETDSQGRYHVGNVSAGRFLVEARATGHGRSAPRDVMIQPGQQQALDLQLGEALVLAGRVVDHEGRPLGNVRVRGNRHDSRMPSFETHTADDGSFSHREAESGEYWLSASLPGFALATMEQIPAPKGDIVIRLTPHGALRGTVRSANQGPLDDFTFEILRYRPQGVSKAKPGPPPVPYRTANGRFEQDELEPGVYDLEIRASGHEPQRLSGVEVTPGEWTTITPILAPR